MDFRAWWLVGGIVCAALVAQGASSPAEADGVWGAQLLKWGKCKRPFELQVTKDLDAENPENYLFRAEGGGPVGAKARLEAIVDSITGPAPLQIPVYDIDENKCDGRWFDEALIHIDRFKDLPAWTFRIAGSSIDVDATFDTPCSDEIGEMQRRAALTVGVRSYLAADCAPPVPPLTEADVVTALEAVRSCGALTVDPPADAVAFAPEEIIILTGRARDDLRRDEILAAVQAIAGTRPVDLRRVDVEGNHRALCDMAEIESRVGSGAPMQMIIRDLDGDMVRQDQTTGEFIPKFEIGEPILVDLRAVPASGYLYAFSVDIGSAMNKPAILIPYDNARDPSLSARDKDFSRPVNDLRREDIFSALSQMRLTVPAEEHEAEDLGSKFGDAPEIMFRSLEADGERIVFFAFVTDRRIAPDGSDIMPLQVDFDTYRDAVLRKAVEGEVGILDVARFEAWKKR